MSATTTTTATPTTTIDDVRPLTGALGAEVRGTVRCEPFTKRQGNHQGYTKDAAGAMKTDPRANSISK